MIIIPLGNDALLRLGIESRRPGVHGRTSGGSRGSRCRDVLSMQFWQHYTIKYPKAKDLRVYQFQKLGAHRDGPTILTRPSNTVFYGFQSRINCFFFLINLLY